MGGVGRIATRHTMRTDLQWEKGLRTNPLNRKLARVWFACGGEKPKPMTGKITRERKASLLRAEDFSIKSGLEQLRYVFHDFGFGSRGVLVWGREGRAWVFQKGILYTVRGRMIRKPREVSLFNWLRGKSPMPFWKIIRRVNPQGGIFLIPKSSVHNLIRYKNEDIWLRPLEKGKELRGLDLVALNTGEVAMSLLMFRKHGAQWEQLDLFQQVGGSVEFSPPKDERKSLRAISVEHIVGLLSQGSRFRAVSANGQMIALQKFLHGEKVYGQTLQAPPGYAGSIVWMRPCIFGDDYYGVELWSRDRKVLLDQVIFLHLPSRRIFDPPARLDFLSFICGESPGMPQNYFNERKRVYPDGRYSVVKSRTWRLPQPWRGKLAEISLSPVEFFDGGRGFWAMAGDKVIDVVKTTDYKDRALVLRKRFLSLSLEEEVVEPTFGRISYDIKSPSSAPQIKLFDPANIVLEAEMERAQRLFKEGKHEEAFSILRKLSKSYPKVLRLRPLYNRVGRETILRRYNLLPSRAEGLIFSPEATEKRINYFAKNNLLWLLEEGLVWNKLRIGCKAMKKYVRNISPKIEKLRKAFNFFGINDEDKIRALIKRIFPELGYKSAAVDALAMLQEAYKGDKKGAQKLSIAVEEAIFSKNPTMNIRALRSQGNRGTA